MTEPVDETLLKTVDGNPVGEVVISDGAAIPARQSEEAARRERDELMRSDAQDIAGDPDAEAELADFYPGYVDVDKRKKATELYIVGHKTFDEIAVEVGVPARTVSMWAFNHKWDELLRREIAAQDSHSVLDLARLRAQKRYEIAKEQFDQAKVLRDTAMESVKSGKTSVKSGTEAWAAAAKIEHTLSGMSEAGTLADINGRDKSGDGDGKEGKRPLVAVFVGGGLPPVRKIEPKETLDV